MGEGDVGALSFFQGGEFVDPAADAPVGDMVSLLFLSCLVVLLTVERGLEIRRRGSLTRCSL